MVLCEVNLVLQYLVQVRIYKFHYNANRFQMTEVYLVDVNVAGYDTILIRLCHIKVASVSPLVLRFLLLTTLFVRIGAVCFRSVSLKILWTYDIYQFRGE